MVATSTAHCVHSKAGSYSWLNTRWCVGGLGLQSTSIFPRQDWCGACTARAQCTGSLYYVCGHVSLQQSLVREALVTHVALEGLLATVEPHVHVKGALLGKAFIAHRTLVRSHACVRHHVLYQVVPERERTPAHAALMRLLTGVDKHVLGIVLSGAEGFPTLRASVGFPFGITGIRWNCLASIWE